MLHVLFQHGDGTIDVLGRLRQTAVLTVMSEFILKHTILEE